MYDNLTVNGKPYTSINGELICDEYLPENNPVNPESSFGWFIYMIIGGGFDLMDEMTTQFLNDCDIISSENLDKYHGANLNLPRPKLMENGTERLLTDKEYKVYLYINNSQLITRLDLLNVFGHCMGDDDSEDKYKKVTVTKESNSYWHTVDHLNYTSPITPLSNIGVNDSNDINRVVDGSHGSNESKIIPNKLATPTEYITYVNIPHNNWSEAFLSFLTAFISIKGNVIIRERGM